MKLACERKDLMKALTTIVRLVNINLDERAINFGSNLYLNANKELNLLELVSVGATNEVKINIAADIQKEGNIVVPIKKIQELINKLPEKPINLEVKKTVLGINCNNQYKANLNGMEGSKRIEEYKIPAELEEIPLSAIQFKQMVKNVSFATKKDDSNFSSVCIQFGYNKKNRNAFRMVGLDGDRVALSQEEGDIKVKEKIQYLISSKIINEIANTIDNDEAKDNLVITSDENKVIFSYKNIRIITPYFKGAYPNFDILFPNEIDFYILINKQDFFNGANFSMSLESEKENSTLFQLEDNKIIMTTISIDQGDLTTIIDMKPSAEDLKFEPIKISSKKLWDVLKIVPTEKILLSTTKSNGNFLLLPYVDGTEVDMGNIGSIAFQYLQSPTR